MTVHRAVCVPYGRAPPSCAPVGPDGVRSWKVLSTPRAPEQAILGELRGEAPGRVVHGSTVATNALLERHGARTVLVTTRRFRDLLEIRRQQRPALYDLEPQRRPHVVAREDVIEVEERLDASGVVVMPLSAAEIGRVVALAVSTGAEAFAICLLFSFANPEHEERLAGAMRAGGLNASASHEVVREHREYERASTTAINAFLEPGISAYVGRLASKLPGLRVLHSGAALSTPEQASSLPVSMLLSGPAGGVLGALAVAKAAGSDGIITFDMGGTSTDVSLIEGGRPKLAGELEVHGYPLKTPALDIHTVGAGGGSARDVGCGVTATGPTAPAR